MNLATARVNLRAKIGNPTVANVPDALLTRLLNSAYKEIATKYPFSEFRKTVVINVVAGTIDYATPADLLSIRRVWDDTNKAKLFKRGVRYIAGLPPNRQPGKPKYYVRTATGIQLDPVPLDAAVLNLHYKAQPDDLALDADSPLIPLSWHDGWVLKARHIYYDEKGDIGKAIYANNAWKDWVADKPSEVDEEKEDMDDVPVELPELSRRGRIARIDPRFDPFFDETC